MEYALRKLDGSEFSNRYDSAIISVSALARVLTCTAGLGYKLGRVGLSDEKTWDEDGISCESARYRSFLTSFRKRITTRNLCHGLPKLHIPNEVTHRVLYTLGKIGKRHFIALLWSVDVLCSCYATQHVTVNERRSFFFNRLILQSKQSTSAHRHGHKLKVMQPPQRIARTASLRTIFFLGPTQRAMFRLVRLFVCFFICILFVAFLFLLFGSFCFRFLLLVLFCSVPVVLVPLFPCFLMSRFRRCPVSCYHFALCSYLFMYVPVVHFYISFACLLVCSFVCWLAGLTPPRQRS